MRRLFSTTIIGLSLASAVSFAHGADNKVVIAYQTNPSPYAIGIANGDLAKKTGWEIEFRKFNSGADILAAIASGDVQIGDVGSSPFAAAVSRGLNVKAIYITGDSGEGEALIVRGSIKTLQDLKGKRLAAAPVSTDHYQLLAVLKQEGFTEKDAQVIAIPQPEIVAAWKRGDIDGAFVWDPALSELKKDGKVLLTSGEVAARGAPVFVALVATDEFTKANPEFLQQYIGLVDQYYNSYQTEPAKWAAGSDNAKLLSDLLGGTPEGIAEQLSSLAPVKVADQISNAWLGGGADSGLAKILHDTAGFLKDQRKITAVRDSYSEFIDPQFVIGLNASN